VNLDLTAEVGLGGVPGITAHGVHAGLKYKDPDLALITTDPPATAAGVFTQNSFAAPPVEVSQAHLDGPVRAIVCNSANANACTGKQGLADAHRMAEVTAQTLGVEPDEVLVSSTGLIGRPLPMTKVETGISACADQLDEADGALAAEAITTTDTQTKQAHATVEADGRAFHVGAIAKGSGMIHPNMATMLAFAATDAPVAAGTLQGLVDEAAAKTFNMITVDGDESTNDMVLTLANGAEGGKPVEPGTPAYDALARGLEAVFEVAARAIAGDGEGATALLEVCVDGAETPEGARQGARAVAGSNLVKAALHGEDPNWGRIVAAIGATQTRVEPDRVTLCVEGGGQRAVLLDRGRPSANGALETAEEIFAADEVRVVVDLGLGPHRSTAYGCDLSQEYVEINAAYTT
jgi:glutamate N-acetyltransferase/amino-acid N-acetyltransferase